VRGAFAVAETEGIEAKKEAKKWGSAGELRRWEHPWKTNEKCEFQPPKIDDSP
jgi:hypothetical protein